MGHDGNTERDSRKEAQKAQEMKSLCAFCASLQLSWLWQMNLRRRNDAVIAAAFLATMAVWLAMSGCARLTSEWRSRPGDETRLPMTITRTNYHGWPKCILMRRAGIEVVI